MTLDEAIKVLKDMREACILIEYRDHPRALQLGIEALKHIQWKRRRPYNEEIIILPGETEE